MSTGSKQIDTGNLNLFGEIITRDALLRDRFIEPPFSILDTTSANWIKRRKQWLALGMQSEVGRGTNLIYNGEIGNDMDAYRHKNGTKKLKGKIAAECLPTGMTEAYGRKAHSGTSIFDPALCELMYHWFCPDNGTIWDPFAGGSVRGIVANKMGYNYTGCDIRPEQIEANIAQGKQILPDNVPNWLCGDSNIVVDTLQDNSFDMIKSCPPYADLEVYSDIPGDISNMDYPEFVKFYESIIAKSIAKLKPGGYAVWVVGEVRNKKGHYHGLVRDTQLIFERHGCKFYNDLILKNAIGTATVRANNSMKNQKVVKIHQNVLVFVKV